VAHVEHDDIDVSVIDIRIC